MVCSFKKPKGPQGQTQGLRGFPRLNQKFEITFVCAFFLQSFLREGRVVELCWAN